MAVLVDVSAAGASLVFPHDITWSTTHHSTLNIENKNLAIANISRVSCAHNMSRASMITP